MANPPKPLTTFTTELHKCPAVLKPRSERGRGNSSPHLILDHLDLHFVADRLQATRLCYLFFGADVQPHARIILERLASAGGLGVAKYNPNLRSSKN